MADKEIAVKVQGLTKSFKIPLEASSGIKQKLINTLKGRKGYRKFTPLNDVSFEIEKGDFFGIVGRNGSGKSTLLKTIAGIYAPEKGLVRVNGKLVPFIELGVGFNPELTGRENVYLNGALLGFSHDEIDAMYDEIIDFAELGDFMEERLKNYSSGMQVRLAFSIAIKAEGDILLLDEVLAVGDEAFQKKCYAYFKNLKRNKKTVILVTHDMSAVEQFCDKGLLLDSGEIKVSGNNREIAQKYKELFIKQKNIIDLDTKKGIYNRSVESVSFSISQDHKKTITVVAKQQYSIDIDVTSKVDLGPAALSISIVNSVGVIVMSAGVGALGEEKFLIKEGSNKIQFIVEDNILNDDEYTIDCIAQLLDDEGSIFYQSTQVAGYTIEGIADRKHALVHPNIKTVIKHE